MGLDETGVAAGGCGELAGIRTQDPRLKRALLYQLSYELVQGRYFQGNMVRELAHVAAAPQSLPPRIRFAAAGKADAVRKWPEEGNLVLSAFLQPGFRGFVSA